jgi:hypothetical protein
MKLLSRFLLLLILVASLVACKPTPAPTPTVTPTVPPTLTATTPSTETPLPATDTPTAEPTAAPYYSGSEVLTVGNIASAVELGRLDLSFASKIFWTNDAVKIGIALENSFQQFDARNLTLLAELPQRVLDVNSDGTLAAVSPDGQTLEILDVNIGTKLLSKKLDFQFGGASFSPDGSRVMLPSMEEWAGVMLSTTDGSLQGKVTGFETAAPVYNVSYGPDGTQAVWVSRATLQISDLSTGTLGLQFNHMDFINSWVLAPQRNLLVTATYGEVAGVYQPIIYLWNTQTGENNIKLAPGEIINGLDLDASGYMLAAGAPAHVLIYDLADASQITQLPLPDAETVTDIAFSPDGKTLAVLAPTATGTILTLWGIP